MSYIRKAQSVTLELVRFVLGAPLVVIGGLIALFGMIIVGFNNQHTIQSMGDMIRDDDVVETDG
ncbi:MAG TPA: hypothetical protein VKW08_01670 [Xanthobacteraceae bacterium]|nr:hypothetical protein [Xanthobacteraceae bacterium]